MQSKLADLNEKSRVSPRPDVRGGQGVRLHRLHDRMAWFLLAVVILSAFPLGSSRPFFWVLIAALIAAAGLYYGIGLERSRNAVRPTPIGWTAFFSYSMLCMFLLIQALPLPWPASVVDLTTADGVTQHLRTISLAPGGTLLMLAQMVSYGLFVVLFVQVGTNSQRRRLLLDVLFFAIATHGAYAIVALSQLGDPVLFFEKWAYSGFATGTFVNRNSFATYLAMGLVLGIGLTIDEIVYRSNSDGPTRAKDTWRPQRSPVLYGVGIAVIFAALLATQSRMGIAAAIGGVLVVAVPLASGLPAKRRNRFLLVAAGGLTTAALLLLFGGGVLERLGSLEGSVDVRFELYKQVVEMISMRPWQGFGGAGFDVAYPVFHALPVSADLVWDKAHNTYLALWVELGLVAGSIPIVLLIVFAVRIARSCVGANDRVAQIVALGALVTVALHSLVDFSLEIEANALLLLCLLSLGLAATRPRRAADRQFSDG